MADRLWNRLVTQVPPAPGWELFHENSKVTRFSDFLPEDEIRQRMAAIWQSLPMAHAPAVTLASPEAMERPMAALSDVIRRRRTPDDMTAAPLSFEVFSALLYHMAGTDKTRGQPERPYRFVPSGGALYPIEVFVHVRAVADIAPGLYYYNPLHHTVHALGKEDRSEEIGACLVQPGLVTDSAVQVFQTALFSRSTFKYADRGYRFIFMEAGHQAQNLNLTATALGLGCIHVGGYRDNEVDRLLGLDGINHSTIYLSVVGTPDDEAPV